MSYQGEEDTLENIKQWWAKWGSITTSVILVIALLFAGWNGWKYWQRQQTAKAMQAYQQVILTLETGQKENILQSVSQMQKQYQSTAYAQMVSLQAAKTLYLLNDVDSAKKELNWTIEHAISSEYKEIARLHLAAILFSEKSYDQGLAILNYLPSKAFKGMVDALRGHLFAAKGDAKEAQKAYQSALVELPATDIYHRNIVQYSLDALGS